MKLQDYIEIETQSDIDSILKIVHGFHDTLLKEFQIVNRAFVDKEKSMNMDFEYNARLMIQCQFEPIRIDFLLINIINIQFEKPFEIFSGDITINDSDNSVELSLDNDFVVKSHRLFYKIEETGFGNSVIYNGQIPHPDMSDSTKIDSQSRQCCECGEIWIVKNEIIISSCPRCNRVTRLID